MSGWIVFESYTLLYSNPRVLAMSCMKKKHAIMKSVLAKLLFLRYDLVRSSGYLSIKKKNSMRLDQGTMLYCNQWHINKLEAKQAVFRAERQTMQSRSYAKLHSCNSISTR